MDTWVFHEKIKAIADHNNNEFMIEFKQLRKDIWQVEVLENFWDDRNVFLSATGKSPEEACEKAWTKVGVSLENWIYSNPAP